MKTETLLEAAAALAATADLRLDREPTDQRKLMQLNMEAFVENLLTKALQGDGSLLLPHTAPSLWMNREAARKALPAALVSLGNNMLATGWGEA